MISAADLAKKKFEGITVPGYAGLLGTIPPDVSIVIWGPKGSLKSTMAIDMANQLAASLGKGIYCSSEEGSGPSLQNKINRLGAANPNLQISDYDNLEKLKSEIELIGAKFVVIDSISMGYIKPDEFRRFMEFCKQNNVILIYILHATKEGNYKGPTEYVHWPDVEIKAMDGVAQTEKNRFKETPQTMSIAATKPSRKNPDPKNQKNQIREGIQAMKRVIKTHKDVPAAMSRPDIGPIDFIWGDKDHGIDHIIRRRDEEAKTIPELKGQKGKDVVLRLPLVIARGTISEQQSGERVLITHQKYGVILSKNYEGRPQNWVLTGFRDYKRKNPDETDGFLSSGQSYTPKTYKRSQSKVGAGSASNIQNSSKNSKKGHANTERDNLKNGRRRGRNKAGHVPRRSNPVRSFSDPLVYLVKTLKVTIDSSDGVRTLKGTGKDNRFPMFASLNKHRLYIGPPESIKRVSNKMHSR